MNFNNAISERSQKRGFSRSRVDEGFFSSSFFYTLQIVLHYIFIIETTEIVVIDERLFRSIFYTYTIYKLICLYLFITLCKLTFSTFTHMFCTLHFIKLSFNICCCLSLLLLHSLHVHLIKGEHKHIFKVNQLIWPSSRLKFKPLNFTANEKM